jgi:hypothetical protein
MTQRTYTFLRAAQLVTSGACLTNNDALQRALAVLQPAADFVPVTTPDPDDSPVTVTLADDEAAALDELDRSLRAWA